MNTNFVDKVESIYKKFMKTILSFLGLVLIINSSIYSEIELTNVKEFSDKGLYISSKGSIKTLVVFVQFKGDSSYPDNQVWPINKPPAFLNSYIDSSENQISAPWSFSDYYRKMSFDSLRIFGERYSITTNYPENYYRDSLKAGDAAYSKVNREVLTRLDSIVNFKSYDNWTFGNNKHFKKPDGIVDLIIILYRNSIWPPGGPAQGIAVLGYDKNLVLDSTIIKFSFPGSGITNSGGWQGLTGSLKSMKHEFGHLLFGGGHPQYYNAVNNKAIKYFGMWGIMPRDGYCANAFEREKLGWIKFKDIDKNESLELNDYVTSGEAVRIKISSNEYYIIENHQQNSIYDSEIDFKDGKGLMIYKVKGRGYHPQYSVVVAEGNYDWSNYWIKHPWRDVDKDSLPVYTPVRKNRNGYSIRDWISHDKPDYLKGKFQIYIMDDDGIGGKPHYLFNGWQGNGKTAFNSDNYNTFAPWTNPGSGNDNNISVVVKSNNSGRYVLDIYVEDLIILKNTELPNEEFTFKNNLIIPEGITLKINPGTKLRFSKNSKLIVNGTLDAAASPPDSIIFEKSSSSENWDGIVFNKGSKGILKNCLIKNSVDGIVRKDLKNGDVKILQTKIVKN